MTATASEIAALVEAFGPMVGGLLVVWLIFARAPRGGTTPEADILAELRAINATLARLDAMKEKQDAIFENVAALVKELSEIKGKLSK